MDPKSPNEWAKTSSSVATNKWVRPDIDIENLIDILRIDKIGVPYVRKLLNEPQIDTIILLNRGKILHDLHQEYVDSIGRAASIGNITSLSFSDSAINRLNSHTDNLLWFLEDHSDETIEYYDSLFFSWSFVESLLNSSPTILHISTVSKIYLAPMMTFLGPVISSLIPIVAMKWYGLDISYTMAIKIVWTGLTYQLKTALNAILKGTNPIIIAAISLYLIFYFWGIWTTIQTSLEKYAVMNDIRSRINNLKAYLMDLHEIMQDSRNKYFRNSQILFEIEELLGELKSESIGNCLTVFRKLLLCSGADKMTSGKLFTSNKENNELLINKLERIIDYSREISGTLCLSRLLRIPGFCLPSFHSNDTPVIDVKNLVHPCLPQNKAVTNDIRLSKNLLITGPNQAGKSTFMRSLLVAVWMAQTIGVVKATSYQATPFDLIYSYIGLTDEIGLESLFQAEMNAVYEYLGKIDSKINSKKVKKTSKAICFFDELFTSTNHEEGVSAALAVGSTLEQHPNAITVISSHFAELGKLDFDKIFLGITTSNSSTLSNSSEAEATSVLSKIKFTYKIQPGISHHRVALRLMKEKGYNPTLVSKAYQNLEELFSKATKFDSYSNSKHNLEIVGNPPNSAKAAITNPPKAVIQESQEGQKLERERQEKRELEQQREQREQREQKREQREELREQQREQQRKLQDRLERQQTKLQDRLERQKAEESEYELVKEYSRNEEYDLYQ